MRWLILIILLITLPVVFAPYYYDSDDRSYSELPNYRIKYNLTPPEPIEYNYDGTPIFTNGGDGSGSIVVIVPGTGGSSVPGSGGSSVPGTSGSPMGKDRGEKEEDSFDEDFENDEPSVYEEYFDPPLGSLTRFYIYDTVTYDESNSNPYAFFNSKRDLIESNVVEKQIKYVKEYKLHFEKNNITQNSIVLPTTSAEDNIVDFALDNGITLSWNENKQLIASMNGNSEINLDANITVRYNYYDKQYDSIDISRLNGELISLSPKIRKRAFDFLNSREGDMSELLMTDNAKEVLDVLIPYFSNFVDTNNLNLSTEGDYDVYQRIAMGKVGACRHRAMAFFITANALEIPTRYVYNDVHAFVEIYVSSNRELLWKAIDLGGTGPGAIDENFIKNLPIKKSDSRDDNPNSTSNVSQNNSMDGNVSGNNTEPINNSINETTPSNNINESSKNISNEINDTLVNETNQTNETNISSEIKLNETNVTNSTSGEQIPEEVTFVEKYFIYIIIGGSFLIIIIITIIVLLLIKDSNGKSKFENIFLGGKKDILNKRQKSEVELLIDAIKSQKNSHLSIVKGYTGLQDIIVKKLNITMNDDTTAREFLGLIPSNYETSNFEKIVSLYEKAYYGRTATKEDVQLMINEILKMANIKE